MNIVNITLEKFKKLPLKYKMFLGVNFILLCTLIDNNDLVGFIPIFSIGYLIWNYSAHWRLWFLTLICFHIAIITLLTSFGSILFMLGICEGGLGSGISCTENWMQGYAGIPMMMSFLMILLYAPIWLWVFTITGTKKLIHETKSIPSQTREVKILHWLNIFNFAGLFSILIIISATILIRIINKINLF